MSFRLVPKSMTLMTLKGVIALICVISLNLVASGAHCVKAVEDIRKISATEMYPKGLVFSDI